jgi:hypothetical protein
VRTRSSRNAGLLFLLVIGHRRPASTPIGNPGGKRSDIVFPGLHWVRTGSSGNAGLLFLIVIGHRRPASLLCGRETLRHLSLGSHPVYRAPQPGRAGVRPSASGFLTLLPPVAVQPHQSWPRAQLGALPRSSATLSTPSTQLGQYTSAGVVTSRVIAEIATLRIDTERSTLYIPNCIENDPVVASSGVDCGRAGVGIQQEFGN